MNKRFLSKKLIGVIRDTDQWPVKHHVTNHDYKHWNKLLNRIFNGNNSTLTNPLKDWIKTDVQRWVTEWGFFLIKDMEFFVHKIKKGVWHRHLRISWCP